MKQERGMAAANVAAANVAAFGPVRHWRIHIGAHKTATTHLQETLTLVRPELAARGLDYIPNPLLRERLFARTLWRRRLLARLPLIGPRHMRETLEAVVAPLRLGPETVVLSEENILGIPDHILRVPFYPQAAPSIARLATLGTGAGARADLVLFLSIRGYDTLLPSAYAESLKFRPPRRIDSRVGSRAGGFDTGRLLARTPSWYDLVALIRRAAPGVPLRIWRQEDYRANAEAIMAEVCGLELGPLPDISDPSWTRSPTAEGIRAAEALDPGVGMHERRERVVALYAASEGERYRPWTAAESEELRARYAADLARIEAEFPGTIMRFPA